MEFTEIQNFDQSIDQIIMPDDDDEAQAAKADLKKQLKPLIKKRASNKGRITRILNKISSTEGLDSGFIIQQCNIISEKLKEIEIQDSEILSVYEILASVSDSIADLYSSEINSQAEFHFEHEQIIFELLKTHKTSGSKEDSSKGPGKGLDGVEPYRLKLPNFSGSQQHVINFPDFLRIFDDLVTNNPQYSDTGKLLYLKSALKNPALSLISVLSSSGENFHKAIDILKKEYFNVNVILEKHFQRIVDIPPIKYGDLDSTRNFLNNLRASVQEFSTLDLEIQEDSFGDKLLSYIVSTKLDKTFKEKLFVITGSSFVNIDTLLKEYPDILLNLDRMSQNRSTANSSNKNTVNFKGSNSSKNSNQSAYQSSKPVYQVSRPAFQNNKFAYQDSKPVAPVATLQTFITQPESSKPKIGGVGNTKSKFVLPRDSPCKLECRKGARHSLYMCPTYTTSQSRRDRLIALKRCPNCSALHAEKDCKGLVNGCKVPGCNSNMHCTSLHVDDNASVTYSNHAVLNLNCTGSEMEPGVLLPSMSVDIKYNDTVLKDVRVQLDHGSVRSFASDRLRRALTHENLPTKTFNLKTLNSVSRVVYEKLNCEIKFASKFMVAEFLVDKNFNIDYKVEGICQFMEDLTDSVLPFADKCFENYLNSETLSNFDLLIGADLLPCIAPLHTENIAPSDAEPFNVYKFNNRYILFGNITEIRYNLEKARDARMLALRQKSGTCNRDNNQSKSDDNCDTNSNIVQSDSSYKTQTQTIVNHASGDCDNFSNTECQQDFGEGRSNLDENIADSDIFQNFDGNLLENSSKLLLDKLFSLESIGIKDENEISNTDKKYLKDFADSITFKDGKYNVLIPYKPEIKFVRNNWKLVKSMTESLYARLENLNLLDAYNKVLESKRQAGVIEPVNDIDFDKLCFIPHHYVLKDSETTPLRVVFNLSFVDKKFPNSVSLNQAYWEGLNNLNSLVSILMRFRTNKFVLCGDIRTAFDQVRLLNEEQRNKMAFFVKNENGDLVVYRYCSILMGSTISQFVLTYVLNYHLDRYLGDPNHSEKRDTILCLKDDLYSDNILTTCNDPNRLSVLYNQANDIMASGGFELRKWFTNFDPLQDQMSKEKRAVENMEFQNLLGYTYIKDGDFIKLSDFNSTVDSNPITLRKLVSIHSSIYDPLSAFLPVIIMGKVLIQDAWKNKMDWDQQLPPDLNDRWMAYQKNINLLKNLKIPRMTVEIPSNEEKLELYCFSDGSSVSSGCTFYLKSKESLPHFIFSKNKMINKAARSVPQAEILGQYLLFRTLPVILDTFHNLIKTIYIFLDSAISIEWSLSGVKGKSQNNRFSKNRVKDIHEMKTKLTSKYNVEFIYMYAETSNNPADMVTKPHTYKEFVNRLDFYYFGPKFLQKSKDLWPRYDLKSLSKHSKDQLGNSLTIPEVDVNLVHNPKFEPLVNLDRFSKITKVYKTMFYIVKFIDVCRKKNSSEVDLMDSAKYQCLKLMQQECFSAEFDYLLKSKKGNSLIPNLINNLDLFIDSRGLLRSAGRLSRLNVFNYDIQNPILLDKNHRLTKLIVENEHRQSLHSGISTVVQRCRDLGLWIPSARSVTRKIIQECILCRKLGARFLTHPRMTNLPLERIKLIHPFIGGTSVDLTGAVYCKDHNGVLVTMYIILFVCNVTRSLHLELIYNMQAKTILNAFSRFFSFYGPVRVIWFDNASYFKASKNYLSEALLSDDFKEYTVQNNITLKNISPRLSFSNGLVEVHVRILKEALRKSLYRNTVTCDELLTILRKCQNAINSRPLTYTYSGRYDGNEGEITPITPNMFLKMYNSPNLIIRSPEEDPLWVPESNVTREDINKSLENQQKIYEHFKETWKKEYLYSLRAYSRNIFQVNWEDKIRKGDVVIYNPMDGSKRPFYKLAIVEQLFFVPGDPRCRSVELRFPGGRRGRHAISHIFPLEIQSARDGSRVPHEDELTPLGNDPRGQNQTSAHSQDTNVRPKRKAAQRQREMLASKIKDDLI